MRLHNSSSPVHRVRCDITYVHEELDAVEVTLGSREVQGGAPVIVSGAHV